MALVAVVVAHLVELCDYLLRVGLRAAASLKSAVRFFSDSPVKKVVPV